MKVEDIVTCPACEGTGSGDGYGAGGAGGGCRLCRRTGEVTQPAYERYIERARRADSAEGGTA